MNPVERVRHLVEAGRVAPEEGERLMAAMAAAPSRSPLRLLVNPFDRFGGGVAAAAGLVVSAASLAVTRLGVRFDGFLDLHVSRAHVAPLGVAVAEQVASWLLPSLLFWAYARAFTRHVRVIDFVGMIGLARLPMLAQALPIAFLTPQKLALPIAPTPSLIALVLVALAGLAWYLTLLYQGFRNASGLRGAKLVGGLVAMSLAAEVASKVSLAVVV